MTKQQLTDQLNKEWLDKLYGFAYRRCSSSHEAEDLCADIILSLLNSFAGGHDVRCFEAFVWGVARKVYADFCTRRRKNSSCTVSGFYGEYGPAPLEDPIEEYFQAEEDQRQYRNILQRIAFLSKSYRDVMVMYYLDEQPVADIARHLSLSETNVKQRLFAARNTIRKEVEKMDVPMTLKPVHLDFIGTGNPIGNDPGPKAERALSQNLVYLCRNKAMSAKELSEELGVPMPYIEEEIDIQCRGENGRYGLLRRLDNGKAIANIVIFDPATLRAATAVYKKQVNALCDIVARNLDTHREAFLRFPFLRPQQDLRFILWSVISGVEWALADAVNEQLAQRHFAGTPPAKREFSTMAIASGADGGDDGVIYGCDGILAENICGYRHVYLRNIYGRYIDFHFHCGHNISTDPLLMMTLRTIDGLPVADLSEEEKEIASKAIECGYLTREEGTLYPKILTLDKLDETAFYRLSDLLSAGVEELAGSIADELVSLMDRALPSHLRNEYRIFNMGASTGLSDALINACIGRGLLTVPENRLCAEGTVLIIDR